MLSVRYGRCEGEETAEKRLDCAGRGINAPFYRRVNKLDDRQAAARAMVASKKSFEIGDLVFAKVKGYPPWPAKVSRRKEQHAPHRTALFVHCVDVKRTPKLNGPCNLLLRYLFFSAIKMRHHLNPRGQVTRIEKNKYNVYFYGTGET